jgi:O-antigen biosynthesis protein
MAPLSGQDMLDRLMENDSFRMRLHESRLVRRYRNNQQTIKVSVIMPTWNRAATIRRAVDSVLRQSYCNYELLISDDGSTDGTEQLIRDVYGRDDRIQYLRSGHAGVSHARNVALNESAGSLIAYLDTDNEWSENYLLLMVNSFIEHPEADTMYCGIEVTDNVHRRHFIAMKRYDRGFLLVRNYIDVNAFMHRRILFESLKGFDQGLNVLEDWELILRYTKARPPFVVECCLVSYHFEKDMVHLSLSENLDEAYRKVRTTHDPTGSV